MVNQNALPRRVLVVDAGPEVLDGILGDIEVLLAAAGHPVRRVDTAGRRTGPTPPGEPRPSPVAGVTVTVGDLVVRADARVARRAGVPLDLTRIEFDLLVEFLRHRNRVLTRDELINGIWQHEPISSNAIEARVSRLRAKLERHGPRLIHTVRGIGYVLHALTGPDEVAGRTVIELVADDPVLDLAPGEPWPAGGRQ